MDGDPRVRQLLEELLDSERTPEEVCHHCPELLPEVHRRWQRKRACDAQLDALFLAPEPHSPFGSPSSTPSSAELPRIPGYEVLEVVGRGGMGVVYRARHVRLDRPVALKMLLTGAHASRESRERFLREARIGAGLRHPNFVQVYDMGDQDGLPYFTMEFVEGGNLAQKLAGMPQPPRQAAALLATLAEAVQAAHRCGIVHRDLKPANVLLTADGTPKICDLGLARRLDGEAGLTWTGTAVGTPSYMAPEQAEARPQTLGPAVDIHALGAILYELLTGRPPFRAETASETVRQVISQDPVPPSRLNGKVPRDLETICLKCLHKEPHLRYAGAAALAADLHHFLGGEAIAARPEGRLARRARRVRRRPVQSTLVAAVTLLTAALLGGGLWLISDRAAAARKIETEQAATERAADTDLREMVQWMRKASWPEARNALERAKSRLGERGSHDIRGRLDRDARDLELADRLDAIRLTGYTMVGGVPDFARSDERYEEAFREAGIDEVGCPPESLAAKIKVGHQRPRPVCTTSRRYRPRCLFPTRRRLAQQGDRRGHAHSPEERHATGRQRQPPRRHDKPRRKLLQPQAPPVLRRRLAPEARVDVLRVESLLQQGQLTQQVARPRKASDIRGTALWSRRRLELSFSGGIRRRRWASDTATGAGRGDTADARSCPRPRDLEGRSDPLQVDRDRSVPRAAIARPSFSPDSSSKGVSMPVPT